MQPLVARLGEQQAARRPAVAPGAAGLLVVALDRLRHRLVADRAHVGLVDAHAERVRRHDDTRLSAHERALHRRAPFPLQPRVVDGNRLARATAPASWRAARSRCACRRRRSPAAHPARRARSAMRRCLSADVLHGTTAKERLGRSKPVVTRTGSLQPQPRDDVVRDLRRRGRRQRDERARLQVPRGVGEAEVVGAEVVAPLRDAVRLVDDEQAQPRLLDLLDEAGRGEALGRDVEQPQLAGDRTLQYVAVLCRGLLRVHQRDLLGRDPPQPVDLILHQRARGERRRS